MISWIVASHRPELLMSNLIPSLNITEDDELILEENAPSITVAYHNGQQRATRQIHCYIHSDVQILDIELLRSELIEATSGSGIVGVIGSRTMVMPWWHGDLLGSVHDSRLGTLNYGPGGECEVVDGLLLATRFKVRWDIDWPGWHGYDYDSCYQSLQSGLTNVCLTNGHEMVSHNSDSPFNLEHVGGWMDAVAHFNRKWGVRD